MAPRSWAVPILAGVAGLACGWLLAPRTAVEPPPAGGPVLQIPRDSPSGAGPADSRGAVSLDDVRRVVREELANSRRETATRGAANDDAGATAPAPSTPAQDAALSRANQLLDAAISRRQW